MSPRRAAAALGGASAVAAWRAAGPGLRALLVVQLVLLVVTALAVATRLPGPALVDELAHLDFAGAVADGRLPVLDRDPIADRWLSWAQGTDTDAPPPVPAPQLGLSGKSYEAFQPPLVYALAAPAMWIAGTPDRQALALRLLGVLALLSCLPLLWALVRRAVAREPAAAPAVFAFAATFLLWPAVVVRQATFSNAILDAPLTLATALLLWDADERDDGRRLVAAGALVGVALLSRLTLLPLALLLAIVAWRMLRRRAVSLRLAAGALALPPLLLAPWIASNLDRYGSPTASAIVRRMQEPFLNPTGETFGPLELPRLARTLPRGLLPEEWWSQLLEAGPRLLVGALTLALVLGPLALAARRRPEARAWLLLALPLGAGLALMAAGTVTGDYDFFLPRYLHGGLAAYAVFAAVAVHRALGVRALLPAAAGATAVLAGLWTWLALSTPFTP